MGSVFLVVLIVLFLSVKISDRPCPEIQGASSGFNFAKAGVMLLDLQPASMHQSELILEDDQEADKTRLMTIFDQLNRRYGQGTIQVASIGLTGDRRLWSMKQERRTPAYTTRWADMLVVRA